MKRKPLAWIQDLNYIHVLEEKTKGRNLELKEKRPYLIWKPELFQPRLTPK